MSAWVCGSASAQATLTDFGALNVRSNPATGCRRFDSTACSSVLIRSIASSRVSPVSARISARVSARILAFTRSPYDGPEAAWRGAERSAGDRVLQLAEHPEQMLLRHLPADRDPVAVAEPGQPGAEEPARRGAGLGVVAGQRGCMHPGAVGLGD